MPVTSSAIPIIFCEGKPESLDYSLLTRILPIGSVHIRTIGGKFSLRAYIEGCLGTYPHHSQPKCIAFRDRDFDFKPPAFPELIPLPGEKPIYLSHRAAIENYFIDAHLIHRYWIERESTPGWGHGAAPSIDKIQEYIQVSAHELADYQAVRWGLANLKPGLRWPEVSTSWTREGSGHIPSSLSYNDCLEQAHQLVKSFQDEVRGIDQDSLQKHIDTYKEQFNSDSFFEEHEYLIWFHGKDHLTQLCRSLASNFPRRHYAAWAAENLEIDHHPDLQQLVDLTEKMIS